MADIAEAQCLIVSQIGSPVDQPQAIEVSVRGSGRASELGNEITATVADELSRLESVTEELTRGALAVGRRCGKTADAPRRGAYSGVLIPLSRL